jgi:hypothetical protein
MVAYVRAGGALGALPFDPVARRATGEATEAIPGSVAWILAPNGTLVQYENAGTFRLARVDRTGKERRLLDRDALYSSPALSPDGRRVALPSACRRQGRRSGSPSWSRGRSRGSPPSWAA